MAEPRSCAAVPNLAGVPFTFAHPVAVLPLTRWFPLPALAAGSIAPDLVYYLPLGLDAGRTHSLTGVFGIDIVLGLLLLGAYRLAIPPLRALPSPRLRTLLTPNPAARRRDLLFVPSAVALGAATHVAWDSFTHTGGFAVEHLTWLRVTVLEPHKLYNVLGYISSIGGLLALALLTRAHRPPAARVPSGTAGVIAPAALLLSAATGTALALTDPVIHASAYDFVRQALLGAVEGVAAVLLLYVAAWWIRTVCPRREGRENQGLGSAESPE